MYLQIRLFSNCGQKCSEKDLTFLKKKIFTYFLQKDILVFFLYIKKIIYPMTSIFQKCPWMALSSNSCDRYCWNYLKKRITQKLFCIFIELKLVFNSQSYVFYLALLDFPTFFFIQKNFKYRKNLKKSKSNFI